MEEMHRIKNQLVKHLKGGEAFMSVEEMLSKIPVEKLGQKPSNLPYSFYTLFYHMWYAQNDILQYCTAENYKESSWPNDYWPQTEAPDTPAQWKELQQAFFDTREKLSVYLLAPENDLLKTVRPGTDHSLLREVLLVIEHNAYHTGQLLVVLRELGLHD